MSARVALRAAAVSLGALICAAHSHAQCQYSVTVLPTTGCFGGAGTPTAINNLGEVIITGSSCAEPSLHRSYIWTGGITVQPIQPPPGWHGAFVEDLNDLHEMVGYAQRQVSGPTGTVTIQEACLWQNGVATLLGIPKGGNFSVATGINNRSEICGYWGNSATGKPALRAFIWREGVMQDLDLPIGPNSVAEDINDRSEITGWMGDSDYDSDAFLWIDGAGTKLAHIPGTVSGRGVAIGDNGMVSGQGVAPTKADPFRSVSGQWRGMLGTNCGMLPDGQRMYARGGNSFATVGICDRPNQIGDRGFLFQNGTLFDLTGLVDGATISMGQDVNDEGQIVATGRMIGGPQSTFLLSPINELDGDVSHDCQVNVDDLVAVILEWGDTDSYADANGSGLVEVQDLILVIVNWTLTEAA